MFIKELSLQDKEIYNQFVEKHPRGSVLQAWEWGELKENFSWQAIRLGIFEEDKIVGAGQILFRKLPLGLRMFYIPRGPLLDFQNHFNLFLEKVKEIAKEKKIDFLRIEPEIFELEKETFKKEINFSFFKKQGFRKTKLNIQPPQTMFVDLTGEDLFYSEIKPKARYNIKLAEKSGVKIKEGKSLQDIEDFANLYKKTAKGKKFFIHSKEYHRKIFFILIPKFASLILASYQNKIIAGSVISIFGKKAIYLYATSDYDYHKLMPPYLVLWQGILKAKENECQFFDLYGVAPENAKNHPWQGITTFKQRFCQGKRTNYLGTFDFVFTKKYWLFLFLEKIRKLFFKICKI